MHPEGGRLAVDFGIASSIEASHIPATGLRGAGHGS